MDENQNTVNGDTTSQNGTGGQAPNPVEQEWTDKGNAAAQEGDYERAAEAFQQAVDADPNNARARYNLALAQQFLGDSEAAIAGYRRAIDLDPQLIDAYTNLGNLYSEIGMNEEALETFQQALEFDPDNDELYLNVGDSYRWTSNCVALWHKKDMLTKTQATHPAMPNLPAFTLTCDGMTRPSLLLTRCSVLILKIEPSMTHWQQFTRLWAILSRPVMPMSIS